MAPKRGDLSSALEDYLETIDGLLENKGAARVRDIAESLGVHKSTVTAALRTLSEKRLINYSPYELTTLTPRGRNIARQVRNKHDALERFLREVLLVPGDVAARNACRMEHVVDLDVLERLIQLTDFVNQHPDTDKTWRDRFQTFVDAVEE